MAQIISSKPFCLENSTQLTRPASESFYRIDGSSAPTIIDKHQAKRLYRLQQAPNVNANLHVDTSEVNYDAEGYFDSIVRKQINESTPLSTKSVYHPPVDMSNASMKRFSLGKARLDPQHTVPSEMTTLRNHPGAITILRHEQGANGEIVPRFTDRLVIDRTLRGRLGPGGTLNPEEDCREAENYLRSQGRLSAPTTTPLTYNPNKQQLSVNEQLKRDETARHYMYTSSQQAAYDEVPWDSKLPSKLPVPATTYEADGSDPVLKSRHAPSVLDARTRKILEWDRVQSRNVNFYRKPVQNVPPLSRADHISGYSGSIGGYHIQEIDDPTVDFKPFTVLRTEQPKFGINPFKTNIPFYTGNTHWTKTDPVSHYDKSGHAYTTSAAFHKPLPVDYATYRHTGLNGQLSRAVTTVIPQNPFNMMDISSTTVNASLDSRAQILIQNLPSTFPSTSKNNKNEEKKEEKPDNNQDQN
ncbi:unnamed protein product [Rotaria socialis]|uniref:Uncharacterized protein n=1 Tax=Rotaria socialis TaxID=392032 RepID=A0A820BI41_9BILA|nr:unnamed protein product [Rotaria socialis]CAF3364243.1 unnamed protein product [Rotaria socialis]CAF3384536.1 unnamed protein product [Rotaria socialis]CAF3409500.1 unnamed protein product [Rotaria socialis]CAF3475743.1 unnamed protein product [Rotaria socialis]